MNIAVIKDTNREYIKATGLYEDEIKNMELPGIELFANLSFLYWAFASEQIEFNQPNNISDEWSLIGGERYSIILDQGLNIYPNSAELNFWKLYFPYRLFMTNFSELDCKELIKKYAEDESLVPYFFLYLFDREKNKDKVDMLVKVCNDTPTAKNLYIKSFIIN